MKQAASGLREDACRYCMSRRRFLVGGAAYAALRIAGETLPMVTEGGSLKAGQRPRVRLVFACWALVQDRPTWPHIGYDLRPEIERVTRALQTSCPEVEFLPAIAHTPEDAKTILAQHDTDRVDGYLVYQMNNWIQVFPPIVASGKPTLVADFLFAGSGGFLRYTAQLRNQYRNFSFIASSRLEDLVAAARCFTLLKTGTVEDFVAACDRVRQERTPSEGPKEWKEDRLDVSTIGACLEAVKRAKIVAVGGGSADVAKALQETMGITVERVGFEELTAACEAADPAEVEEVVERWKNKARVVRIEEPEETLRQSARNYLGQKALMGKYQAEAITINCLGGFYSGRLAAYPCLGYVELLNTGLIGACEADLVSTGTMVVMNHLIHRPGYISDPVMDTSKRQIIYAHCVATTKPFGPEGPENDFEILPHAEDQRGASVRSFLPLGYLTSTLEIHPLRREILLHRGKAVENIVLDRACRTKLACEVIGDMEKLFTFWDEYGWHRVTFYGDLREPVKELAQALSFRFVEEA